MTNKPTTKRLIVGLMVFATGLVTLISLLFPLLTVSDVALDGKTLLATFINILEKELGTKVDIATGESGFSLMDLKSSAGLDEGFVLIGGLLAGLILLLSVAAMAIGIVMIFAFDEKRVRKLTFGFAGGCIAAAGIYCIYGIVVERLNCYVAINEYSIGWHFTEYHPSYVYGSYNPALYFETYTMSYFALMLVLPFAIASMLCQSLIKERSGVARVAHSTTNVRSAGATQYCGHCGAAMQQGSNFCMVCGLSADNRTKANTAQQTVLTRDSVNWGYTQSEPQTERVTNNKSYAFEQQTEKRDMKAVAEELKTLKQLLDDGIIAQEDYDEQKRKILG